MKRLYIYRTRVGPFYISEHEGRYHVVFRDESIGNYPHPWQASDDLAGGHTFTPPGGVDTAALGIPADLSEWERLAS